MNPLEQQVAQLPYRPSAPIQAVVADVRENGYAKDPRPTIYWCGFPGFYPDPEYLLKAQGDPLLLSNAVRQKIRSIEPGRAVYNLRRLTESLEAGLDQRKFQTMLLSLFGGTALLLAVIGLYGVTSFSVSQRTREIGLRMALGAAPVQILRQVFREGAMMLAIGAIVGLAAAAALSRSMSSLLFGIAPLDPVTFAVVPSVLGAVAAVALFGPARRAMRVDPVEALRTD
jgi:ABC-type antimicrobial peptide transport system permease subunit